MMGMLATYNGYPAFFFQKSPPDTDRKWTMPCFPRADYNIDMKYDPERKVSGNLTIDVKCTTESKHMPEDFEQRLVNLINGAFYTAPERATVAAVWSRSDAFDFERTQAVSQAMPEVFGITIEFDLMEFPAQITTDPDPIQGLNYWTRVNFPDMAVIADAELAPVWKPSDEKPAIYWRFEGTAANDQQSYAVNWYTGKYAAHVIADSVKARNAWTKAIAEHIQIDGEIPLIDGSPMFAKQLAIRHNADPLREGQLLLTGQYGVLAQHRRESAQIPINRAVLSNMNTEVVHDKK